MKRVLTLLGCLLVLTFCSLVVEAETNAFINLSAPSRASDGSVTLTWSSETNRFSTNFFTVLGTAQLTNSFLPVTASVRASAPSTVVTDFTFASSAQAFYQLQTTNNFTDLTQPLAWEAYNVAGTGGLDTRGYVGAVFDGRYLYFAPYQDATNHGNVLRFDTRGDFTNSTNWRAYNAWNTGGLPTKGFQGGIFDGHYVYFSPAATGAVLRLDTTLEFTNSGSWSAYDASHTDGLNTYGFQGAVFDGRYVYFSPHFTTAFDGVILRYDTQGSFTNPSSWHAYDAGSTSGLVTRGYSGGVFDGRYVYFVPVQDGSGTHGRVLRLDPQGNFTNSSSWLAYDAGNSTITNTTGFKGGVFDGQFIYFIPYAGNGRVLRYDTTGNFTNSSNWTGYNADNTDGLPSDGYMDAAYDGRYVWLAPYFNTTNAHGIVLRFDTQGTFTNSSSWHAYDAGPTGGLDARGFNGAAYDGRYIYFVPYHSVSGFSGIVVRFDARLPRQIPAAISGGSFF